MRETRIVLLDGVAVDGVVEKESKVRVQIKERALHERITPERSAAVEGLAVVRPDTPLVLGAAVAGADRSESVDHSRGDQVERDLTGGSEAIQAAVPFEAEAPAVVQSPDIVARYVVPVVIQWPHERPVGVGSLIRK